MKFISRYDIFGYNGCQSACEGTGFIPHYEMHGDRRDPNLTLVIPRPDENDPPIYRVLWFLMEAKEAATDGYHFLPCPTCKPDDLLVKLAQAFLSAPAAARGDGR